MRLRRGASGPKFPLFQAALLKAIAWMNSCKTFMKRSKDVSRLKSPRPSPAAPNGCWNCLHEIVIRSRLRSYRRASWLDPASRQWQPSYLWLKWKYRAAFNSNPWQQAFEDGPAAAFGEACRNFGRRSLAARNSALRVLSSPSPRACGERVGVRGSCDL